MGFQAFHCTFHFFVINSSFFHKVETLQKAYGRLDGKSAVELLLLLKSLGMHSINPLELRNVIALLKQDTFPFKSHIIHVLSSMSKGHGFTVCRQYFDMSNDIGK